MSRDYYERVKGLLIFSVVLGHFFQKIRGLTSGTVAAVFGAIVIFIYSFHMPAFVFISGYFSKNIEKRRDRAFVDLLIPYFFFQIIFGCGFAIINHDYSVLGNIFNPAYGMWYLLALFIYRLILPYLKNIKHILAISIILNICTCLFYELNDTMALQRTVGFLVFFIAGFYCNEEQMEKLAKKIPRTVAFIVFAVEIVVLTILFVRSSEYYALFLKIGTHSAVVSGMNDVLKYLIIYIAAFIVAIINTICIFSISNGPSKVLQRFGGDTMPQYLSHIVFFCVISVFVPRLSRTLGIIVTIGSICFCLFVFSSKWYVRLFNQCTNWIKKMVVSENTDR